MLKITQLKQERAELTSDQDINRNREELQKCFDELKLLKEKVRLLEKSPTEDSMYETNIDSLKGGSSGFMKIIP